MLARRLVRRYSRSTPRATERQLMPGERPLGLLQFHDERRQRRAELVEHLRVVDDRVLLHVRRLPGFLHVVLANRGVCKTGIGVRPFRADLLVELRQPQAQVIDREDQLHRAATEQGMRFPIIVMQHSRLQQLEAGDRD
jgi:hypothetical protein